MTASGKADQGYVRKHNASLVLHQLRLHAPLSRADLAKRIGLNRSTISSIIAQLLEEGFVHETELQTDKVGRPGLSLELNPEGGCALGVEIGVQFVHVILTDFVANIQWRRRIRIAETEPQETYLHIAQEMARQALTKANELEMRVLGIGICLPGMVDVRTGELKYAPNLKWHDIPIRQKWVERFGLPVFVENDANAAAMGEYYFGVARDAPNFIYLSAGAGLGGGIVIDGQLFRGRGGFAGEIGHMTIDPNGEPCICGKRGCWETLVGPRTVIEKYKRRSDWGGPSTLRQDLEDIGFAEIVEAAGIGDLVAMAVLQDVGTYLGIGIANLVNVFNPQLVVLGGELSVAGELLVPVIIETVKQNSLFPMRTALSIVPSSHGTDHCVLGAVALILDDLLGEPVYRDDLFAEE